MSGAQAIVGLVAGLTSIAGGVYSAVRHVTPEPTGGEMLAVVREVESDRPLRGATVEILTAQAALVTTLKAADDGSVRRALAPGPYQVRAIAPQREPETRLIEVAPGDTARVQFQLARRADTARGGGASRPGGPGHVVSKGVGAVHRFLYGLGL